MEEARAAAMPATAVSERARTGANHSTGKRDGKTRMNTQIYTSVADGKIRRLHEKLLMLTRAAREAQCECSLLQRDSGHVVGCWMPDLQEAIKESEQEL